MRVIPGISMSDARLGSRVDSVLTATFIAAPYIGFLLLVGIMFARLLQAIVSV
jgi:hypothetical protein